MSKPKSSFTADEIAKAKAFRDGCLNGASEVSVEPEWLFMAEFGCYFGWQGIMAILTDQITLDVAIELLRGARVIGSERIVDSAMAAVAGEQFARTQAQDSFKRPIRHHIDRLNANKERVV